MRITPRNPQILPSSLSNLEGAKIALQRAWDVCYKTNDQKEYGRVSFKWLHPLKSLALFPPQVPPVTIEAFDEIMSTDDHLGMKILISCCTPPE